MASNWYFSRDKQKLGPFSFNQIRQLGALGLLQRTDHVLEEGTAKWREAGEVDGLFPRPEGPKAYHLAIAGQAIGPYTADQVRMLLLSGRLAPEIQACAQGAAQWVPLSQIPDFSGYVPRPSESHAVLVRDTGAQLSKEEAELHLAGKKGDVLARLLSRLLDLKRHYADNPSLVETLDKSIRQLQTMRAGPPIGG